MIRSPLTLIVATSLACLALPAPARAETVATTFVRDGITYSYTTEQLGNGRRILRGTAAGQPFRLVVGARRVTGTYDFRPVDFPLSEVRPFHTARRDAAG